MTIVVAANDTEPKDSTGQDRLVLLQNGAAGFRQLMQIIESASRTLRLLFYTFADDETGTAVRHGLLAARARGVTVSLIVDDFGSLETRNDFFTPLTDAGCRFCKFQPRLLKRYLLRNHQKIAIADESQAIIGSFNIADSHMKPHENDAWRDIGVYLEGGAAGRLARYFDAIERWVTSKRPRMRRLKQLLAATNETDGAVRWIFGGPARGDNNYLRQVREEFGKAQSADLIMAYFAPPVGVLAAVRTLARRGRFRLIAAAKTDVKLSRAAAWHTYRMLLRDGAEIYEYQPRPLHTKLMIIDDTVFIGSGNFDVRSLYVNLEVMLRVERPDFVATVREMFEAELADSERIDLATLRAKRRWYKRILWRSAYFLLVTVDAFLSKRFAR